MNNNNSSSPAPSGEQLTFDLPVTELEFLQTEVIELAYEEAVRKIDNQTMIILNTQRIIQTMLGWLLAAIVSLTGVLATLVVKGDTAAGQALAAAGILALAVPSFILWKGALYKTSLNSSGSSPSQFLHRDTVEWLNGIDSYPQATAKKYQELRTLQGRFERNAALMDRMRDAYRSGVRWLATGLAAVILILLPLVAALG